MLLNNIPTTQFKKLTIYLALTHSLLSFW